MWELEKRGCFTVSIKSSYKLINVAKSQSRGECFNNCQSQKPWKQIRKMRVPNKINVISQRACQNNLPILQNLRQKKKWNSIIFVKVVKLRLKMHPCISVPPSNLDLLGKRFFRYGYPAQRPFHYGDGLSFKREGWSALNRSIFTLSMEVLVSQ